MFGKDNNDSPTSSFGISPGHCISYIRIKILRKWQENLLQKFLTPQTYCYTPSTTLVYYLIFNQVHWFLTKIEKIYINGKIINLCIYTAVQEYKIKFTQILEYMG